MQWNEHLPDTEAWIPGDNNEDTLRRSLMVSCRFAQARIVSRTDAETRFNLHSFDAGVSVEDIIREELGAL